MTLFYNPKTKKTKLWIIFFFILIPIMLLVLGYVFSQKSVGEYKKQKMLEEQEDIFKNF